jgi:hypothetical protein
VRWADALSIGGFGLVFGSAPLVRMAVIRHVLLNTMIRLDLRSRRVFIMHSDARNTVLHNLVLCKVWSKRHSLVFREKFAL